MPSSLERYGSSEQVPPLRILGIVQGDPWAPLTMSGAAASLLNALDRRFSVVQRLDYGLHGRRRIVQAAVTFRPRRHQWVARFYLTPRAHRALSATLADRLQGVDEPFDLAFQVHGWVSGQPRPYFLYVDQTWSQLQAGWPKMLTSRSAREKARGLERVMYGEAHHIFVMGEPARRSLIADYEVPSGRISVTGGGCHFQSLPPPVAAPASEPRILFIGREFERKGGEVLLQAFRAVRARVPTATLHIVGSRRRFTDPGVLTHGIVANRDEMGRLYGRARLLCAPSLYEPWGFALVEAMAYGVPCIGTTVGSVPEILDRGRAGMLVPPGDVGALADSIINLLSDDSLAWRLGIEGRKRVEHYYTWDRVVDAMVPAITSVRQRARPTGIHDG